MRKATKRSVILGCIFVLLTGINLVMEYKKSNPTNLAFSWFMLVVMIAFALASFIRYRKTEREGK
jgi:divalent metal cation (Fe/Co/Zn/Cd) transporter